MSYESISDGSLDYFPCRYGASPNLFRGPKRQTVPPFVTVLGGTETYGRFIRTPYPNLLEAMLDRTVINLGAINSSVDLYINDTPLIDMTNMAQLTVLQVTGAHNLTNRFYTVHPRRNDRFLRASALLRSIYRDVDFSEFNFTRHLLHSLHKHSPDRFMMVVEELRQSWLARMTMLLRKINSPVLLLLLAKTKLPESEALPDDWLDRDPLLIHQGMVRQLSPLIARNVEVIPPPDKFARDLEGMVFSELETPAAKLALPPSAHRYTADMLHPLMEPFLNE